MPNYIATPPDIQWTAIAPILIVATTGILALLPELRRDNRNNSLAYWISLAGLAVAGLAVWSQFGQPAIVGTFAGMVNQDSVSLTMQLLIIGATFICIMFSEGYLREKRIAFGEFYPLALWSASGAMVMSVSQNLLMIFLGVEILSIALYVMAGMSRTEEKSEESALKYFLLGAFASAFLLYGIAMVYGATGTLDLASILPAWERGSHTSHTLLLFGMGMMLIGLSFKASFVPFHQWTPDVYQGAPTNVTTFMASASKIGAFGALIRILDGAQVMSEYWIPALYWIAILTMVFGNLIALVQKDVKRVLGYSSIAHAGYMLVGVIAHYKDPANVSLDAVLYYLLSYSLMTIGAFAVVSIVAKGGKESTRLKDLHGLWHRSPLAAGALLLFTISLIGIPLTSGFFGKFVIFNNAMGAGLAPLAIVLAITSIVSTYYYLGIAYAAIVADEEKDARPLARMHPGLQVTCLVCGIGVIAVTVFYTPVAQLLAIR